MAEAALVLTFLAFLLFAFSHRKPNLQRWGFFSLAGAAAALLGALVWRSIQLSFPAMTSSYEGLLLLALGIIAFLLVARRRLGEAGTVVLSGSSLVAFLFLAILSSPLVPAQIVPPVPILRSGWLVLHVAFAFIGLALFTVGAVAAAVGLAGGRGAGLAAVPPDALSDQPGTSGADTPSRVGSGDRTLEPMSLRTDRVRDDAIVLGYVFYAVGGLIFGAIWAEAAWGRFWGWDPKETWALITTLVYTGYLHLRYVGRVRQQLVRILAIVAWVVAVFTFWGVNYLFAGLHSYA